MHEHFNFKNLKVEGSLETYADSKLSHILDLAPDGAVIEARVEKKGVEVRCSLVINTEAASFKAFSQAKDLRTAVNRLERKMLTQFAHWKAVRFGSAA